MLSRSECFAAPRALMLFLAIAVASSLAVAQTKPIPDLAKRGGKFTFMVDGKPFLMLGGQVGNFTAFPDRMRQVWPSFKKMHANTVEFPVYWHNIEPEEGKFDFGEFDEIIRGARAQGLRAIVLWFGTWKNGAMDWTPNWVKENPDRFPRVLNSGGRPIRALSPHSTANLEADKKAYVELVKHIREFDEAQRTVIMLQVQNEPGSLASPRDFSPEATKLFNGPVPADLVKALDKKPGTWKSVFGRVADEAFNAYHIAKYIDASAAAGKQIYPLPTLVNVWNGGNGTNDNFNLFDRPGETYPSGGAVSGMLDLWKAVATSVDIIAPDIYHQSPMNYDKILRNYTRPDNPLLIVETGREIGKRAFYYAIADYSAIGFAPFGVGEELRPDLADIGANFRVVESATHIITELQGTGRLQAAVEERFIQARNLIFENYDILVRFRPPGRREPPRPLTDISDPTGRALIAQLGSDEFLLMGFDSVVEFRPVQGSDFTAAQFLEVSYGVYENGVWKELDRGRTAQSDYALPGVSLPADGAMARVRLLRY